MTTKTRKRIRVVHRLNDIRVRKDSYILWNQDALRVLKRLPNRELFDLVITSPPYNIGKEYEKSLPIELYLQWQKSIINEIICRLKSNGSICWVIGNYAKNAHIVPLDILLHPTFSESKLLLRNRIIWRYGHGLHAKRRFSGRYEVIMWYTKGDDYTFNLDQVRIPSKYPGKKYYRGPRRGEISSNPLGKNPEDVWDIPQVKSSHIEKTNHPCQFPMGMIERLILALSKEGDVVFDPFTGSGTTGAAAAVHGRIFWGSEIRRSYVRIAEKRINDALWGALKYRPHDKPIYDHTTSSLSLMPEGKNLVGSRI